MKKRWITLLAAATLLLCLVLGGCGGPAAVSNTEGFRLSGVEDMTGDSGICAYTVTAPYTDSYTMTCEQAAGLATYEGSRQIAGGATEMVANLTAGKTYTLQIQTAQPNTAFSLHTQADNHLITLPYDTGDQADISALSAESQGTDDPCTPAAVNYEKRTGGTYIYSNNPEMLAPEDIGQALLRSPGLTGEVYMTFEHANYAGTPFYLGYQLKNDGDTDVYVTVTNIGYQAGGTWFGQQAWNDFYNTKFELPSDYFTNKAYKSTDYGYTDYTPRVFQPVTYRLPAGAYFYVIGGTTEDAYQGISVDGSADKLLNPQKCANGNVMFTVTGGTVTGTMYAYDDVEQVKANPVEQGYVTLRTGKDYGAQYEGTQDHAGVIDNYTTWTFNDSTAKGRLPVTYTNSYDENVPAKTTPYEAYNSTEHTKERAQQWQTHLNPQNDHNAVGMDMVDFSCVDTHGNPVVVDSHHADGSGAPANTANWMIEYQDHFTLVNQGDTARTVKFGLKDNGSLALLVRDGDGNVLEAKMTTGLVSDSAVVYTVEVAPHSIQQLTLDYVLVACSYGSVTHFAILG